MTTIPAKIKERIITGIKKFQKILQNAKINDVNEADTVAIIKDMLCEIFGYDKYSEITSEYAVKKTFCDLAIKRDDRPYILIEAKAIGIELKNQHTKQALDYGANAGIDWIVLSNGLIWKVYKVSFAKPINTELVYEFDISTINTRKDSDLEMLYYLCKEANSKSKNKGMLDDFREQRQLLSRFMLGQLLLCDDVLGALRRSIKKISPDAKVNDEEIRNILETDVIKREIFDDERSAEAKKKIVKAFKLVASKKIVREESTEA